MYGMLSDVMPMNIYIVLMQCVNIVFMTPCVYIFTYRHTMMCQFPFMGLGMMC